MIVKSHCFFYFKTLDYANYLRMVGDSKLKNEMFLDSGTIAHIDNVFISLKRLHKYNFKYVLNKFCTSALFSS